MKFLSLKSKINNTPSPESLRQPIFDVDKLWKWCLLVCLCIILTTFLIGFNFFYHEYKEDYKDKDDNEVAPLIDINNLKNNVQKRDNLISKPTPVLRDPSI